MEYTRLTLFILPVATNLFDQTAEKPGKPTEGILSQVKTGSIEEHFYPDDTLKSSAKYTLIGEKYIKVYLHALPPLAPHGI